MEFFNNLLDWIFYKKCYLCSKPCKANYLCKNCCKKIENSIKKRQLNIDGISVYMALPYKHEVLKILRGLKYHNKKDFAQFLAELIFDFYKQELFDSQNFDIVPIPLFFKRHKKRKYNQTELIALELSKISGFKVNSKLIERIKDTKPQYRLNKKERSENLKNAFKVNKNHISERNILLLDDLCTTGTTFSEIIKELKNNSIYKITCIAVAYPISE